MVVAMVGAAAEVMAVVVMSLSLLAVVKAGTVVAVEASRSDEAGGARRYKGGPWRGSKSGGSAYWSLTACGTCGIEQCHYYLLLCFLKDDLHLKTRSTLNDILETMKRCN